jgi:hypothetical protein
VQTADALAGRGFQGFQGAAGSGSQGFQGRQGSAGAQGSQGTAGSDGAQGFQGDSGASFPPADQSNAGNVLTAFNAFGTVSYNWAMPPGRAVPQLTSATVIDGGTISATFDQPVSTNGNAGPCFSGNATTAGPWAADTIVGGEGTTTLTISLISGGFVSGDSVTMDFNNSAFFAVEDTTFGMYAADNSIPASNPL